MQENKLTNDLGAQPREAARREIDGIGLDTEFMAALQDPAHPGHRVAATRRRELYAAAFDESSESKGIAGRVRNGQSPSDIAGPETHRHFAPVDSPTDYRFDPVPQGLTPDVELESRARDWFHEAGVPQWLARNIVREWNRAVDVPPDDRALEESAAATEKSLRRSWGRDYEAKIDIARSLVRSNGNDEVFELLDRSGMANSEYLIRQLVGLAESRAKDSKS